MLNLTGNRRAGQQLAAALEAVGRTIFPADCLYGAYQGGRGIEFDIHLMTHFPTLTDDQLLELAVNKFPENITALGKTFEVHITHVTKHDWKHGRLLHGTLQGEKGVQGVIALSSL